MANETFEIIDGDAALLFFDTAMYVYIVIQSI